MLSNRGAWLQLALDKAWNSNACKGNAPSVLRFNEDLFVVTTNDSSNLAAQWLGEFQQASLASKTGGKTSPRAHRFTSSLKAPVVNPAAAQCLVDICSHAVVARFEQHLSAVVQEAEKPTSSVCPARLTRLLQEVHATLLELDELLTNSANDVEAISQAQHWLQGFQSFILQVQQLLKDPNGAPRIYQTLATEFSNCQVSIQRNADISEVVSSVAVPAKRQTRLVATRPAQQYNAHWARKPAL